MRQARLVKAFKAATSQAESQLRVNATAKANGEPVVMQGTDWKSLVDQFKAKYGQFLPDNTSPAQSYYEAFEEKLADGELQAETLAHVLDIHEEETPRALKPEPSRQVGLHLDATLTIQTCRRYMSTMPTTTEELRDKFAMRLLAQLRQPGRALYSDLTPRNELLTEQLSTRSSRLEREIRGVKMIVPQRSHCLEYEFHVRKAPIQLTRSQGLPIQKALWSVCRNEQHRMEHRVTLLTIANAAAPSSPNAALTSNLNRMEQQIATPLRERSRTPTPGKGSRNQPKAAQQSQPASTAPYQQKKCKGKGAKGSGKKGTGKGKVTSQPAERHLRSFHEIRQLGARAKAAYHANASSEKGVCWNFLSHMPCPVTPRPRHHTCIGCGKANVPYDDCHCLENVL